MRKIRKFIIILSLLLTSLVVTAEPMQAEKYVFDMGSYLTIEEQVRADALLNEMYIKSNKKVLVKFVYISENSGADVIGSLEKKFGNEKRKTIIIVRTEKKVDVFVVNLPKETTQLIKEIYYTSIKNSNSYISELENFKNLYTFKIGEIKKISEKSGVGLFEIIATRDIHVYISLLFKIIIGIGVLFGLSIYVRRKINVNKRK
jgi:hypothetical protein